ncbi:MAG: VWA domain-containing protein [Pseudomonadales bacterium]
MQRKLIDFVRVLRNADVRVSTSESIDAMQAMALVGYDDRLLLKQALSATLAKTEEEKSSFDYCFENFFAFQDPDVNAEERTDSSVEQEKSSDDNAKPNSGDSEPSANSGGDESQSALDGLADMLMNADAAEMSAEVVRASDAVGVSDIKIFTQKGQYSRRVLQQMGLEGLEETIHELEQSEFQTDHLLAEELKQRRDQLRDRIRNYVEQQYLLFASNAGQKLREDVLKRARLSSLDAHYFRDMQMLVHKMAKKLASQHSRRKKIFKKGQLNAGKTIRRNIANDGILFETHWKFKRKDRPKVLAICDVSGSVSLYARFLLMLLYSLHDVLPNVRSFAFSSQLGEVTDILQRYPVEKAIELINHQYGMGSTDYGSAFQQFSELCLDSIDRHTTIIMLGDGRNNYGDPQTALLKAMHDRCQRLLWLNPENKSLWSSGDSEMRRYAVYSHDAVECNTLGQLEKTISRMLRLTL